MGPEKRLLAVGFGWVHFLPLLPHFPVPRFPVPPPPHRTYPSSRLGICRLWGGLPQIEGSPLAILLVLWRGAALLVLRSDLQ